MISTIQILNKLDAAFEANWLHLSRVSTLSERHILERWCALSLGAKWIYIHLHNRRSTHYRKSEIQYWSSDSPILETKHDQDMALKELLNDDYLIECSSWLAIQTILERYTVAELKELCKVNKRKVGGPKVQIIERLTQTPLDYFEPEIHFIIGHHRLFNRVWTQVLHHHQGSVQPLLLSTYETIRVRTLPMKITKSYPLHFSRKEYQQYRHWRTAEHPSAWLSAPPIYVSASTPQYRFSGYRFWLYGLIHSNQWSNQFIDHCYNHISGSTHHPIVRQRLALHLLKQGTPKIAFKLIKDGLKQTMSLSERIQYETTAQHIARRTQKGVPPPITLLKPKIRRLRIDTSKSIGHRKSFKGKILETGVVQYLEGFDILALRTENTPWNDLFGILFLPAILQYVPYTFSSPVLSIPSDYGTPLFYKHRQQVCDAILMRIQQEQSDALFTENLSTLSHPIEEYNVRGISITQKDLPKLRGFLKIIPANVLFSVMKWKLLSPSDTARGLPDICIFVPNQCKIDALFPSKLSSGFKFVELKSKTDSLSSYQKAWNHRLLSDKCAVEVWNVYR